MPVKYVGDRPVTTIEGPSADGSHPLQKAWIEEDVVQCGYCQSGQIMAAAALLKKKPKPSASDVDTALSANLCQLIGPDKVVGVLAARKQFMTQAHLAAVGIQPGSNYVLEGAEDDGDCTEFENLWNANVRPDPAGATYDKAEKDFVRVASEFYRAYPNLGAMLLECTGMQPFARAVEREIDIPIFSWGTLLDYLFSLVHRDYYGHV